MAMVDPGASQGAAPVDPLSHHLSAALRQALWSSMSGIAFADLSGCLVWVNPAFLALWGYGSEDDVRGRPVTSFWQQPEEAVAIVESLQREGSWFGERTARRRGGTTFLAQFSASLVRDDSRSPALMMGSFVDITERRQAEKWLGLERARLDSLLELSQKTHELREREIIQWVLEESVRFTDSRIGYLHFVNPDQRTIELVTWSKKTTENCTAVHDSHYPLDKAGVWADCARTRKPVVHNDYQALAGKKGYPEGHTPVVRHLSVPVIDGDQVVIIMGVGNKGNDYDDGDIRQMFLMADHLWRILRRKRAEEALAQRTAELVARNEDLDAFSHTAAHDLKGPLSMVIAYAQTLIAEAEAQGPECRSHLEAIERNGRKMHQIIDNLLLLAEVRTADGRPQPLDMAAILAEARGRLSTEIAALDAHVDLGDPAAWPRALGVPGWIEEVWVNYLSNALKYGGRPPRVDVTAALADDTGPGARQVRFCVWDNGQGLTPDEQACLFVPFTRLEQVQVRGHGLGLSIVRRIVEKLGGRVGVESEVGKGSAFFFTLPLA